MITNIIICSLETVKSYIVVHSCSRIVIHRCSCNMEYVLGIIVLLDTTLCRSLHISGTWNGDKSFLFLSKFGFQQTDISKSTSDARDTEGFIYGNITAPQSQANHVTLVVVDSEYFMEYFGNRTKDMNRNTCVSMFKKIDTIAFHRNCHTQGKEDFLRTVPCEKNKLCEDEDRPSNVIPSYQFTYRIDDKTQPRFWYISLVACYRDDRKHSHCSWNSTRRGDIELNYDIWLVNGDPSRWHRNPFEHQFTFEEHDIFEMYIIFMAAYLILIPIWLCASPQRDNALIWLLTTCMVVEASGLLLNLLHVIVFSIDGRGFSFVRIVGDYLGVISENLLVLVLLLMAKGWMINCDLITDKLILMAAWIASSLFSIGAFSFFTVKSHMDPSYTILNLDLWQTASGYALLATRMALMLWFIFELRRTTKRESNSFLLQRLLHFAAFYLTWFIYLPILVIVESQISALWKLKVGLSVSYSADLLAYAVLVHSLWPSRTLLYLTRREPSIRSCELEAAGIGLLSVAAEYNRDAPDSGLETPGRHTPEFHGSLRLIDDANMTSSENCTIKGHNYKPLLSIDLSDDEL